MVRSIVGMEQRRPAGALRLLQGKIEIGQPTLIEEIAISIGQVGPEEYRCVIDNGTQLVFSSFCLAISSVRSSFVFVSSAVRSATLASSSFRPRMTRVITSAKTRNTRPYRMRELCTDLGFEEVVADKPRDQGRENAGLCAAVPERARDRG